MVSFETLTPEQLYDLLTPENKEVVTLQIELLLASQSDHQ